MKKYISILITAFLILSCSLIVHASEGEPETAQDSTAETQTFEEPESNTTTTETKTAAETEAFTEYGIPPSLTGVGTVIASERAEDGKVFYTIEADDGSVFYLIIDNDNMQNNVYFLSPVTAQDLLSLAKNKSETSSSIQSIFAGIGEENDSEQETSAADAPATDGNSPGWLMQNLPFIIIFILAAAIAAAYYWFKIRRKNKISPPPEYDGPDMEEELEEVIREDGDE